LSGHDTFETLDAAQLYHEHDYRSLPHPLQIPQDGYAHDEYAYATHSSGASLSGKRIALFQLPIIISASLVRAIYFNCAARTSHLLRSLLVIAIPAALGRWFSMSSTVPPMACSEANSITQFHLHVI
jgi:hypothetical protein